MDVQPWLNVTPKFSVIRLEKSIPMSSCEAGGTSAVLAHATVGIDISSATQGSSVASVAGRKRAPTKQWARASEVNAAAARLASTSVCSKCRDMRCPPNQRRDSSHERPLRAALHHALCGGPLGCAIEYRVMEAR